MERSKLEFQPPTATIPGDYANITLLDVKRFEKDLAKVNPNYGEIHVSEALPEELSAIIHEFSVVNEPDPKRGRRLRASISFEKDTHENTNELLTTILMNLQDDDRVPIYTELETVYDDTYTVRDITFEETCITLGIGNGRIEVLAAVPHGGINTLGQHETLDEIAQWLSRVVVSSIDAVVEHQSNDIPHAGDIVLSVPDIPVVPQLEAKPATPEHEHAQSNPLDSIGGNFKVKEYLQERAYAFHDREQLKEFDIPCNIPFMLHGAPGTGKTMMAKAFAELIGAKFNQVDTTQLANKYIGQSANNTKEIFDKAKENSESGPYVLFFDEFDSVSKSKDDLHDEYQKVINVFKIQIEEIIRDYPNLIVIACSNGNINEQEKALFRAGRFDAIEVPYPNDFERAEIWSVILNSNQHTRVTKEWSPDMFNDSQDDAVDETALAEASKGLSGADIREITKKFLMQSYLHKKQTEKSLPVNTDILLRHITHYKNLNSYRVVDDSQLD